MNTVGIKRIIRKKEKKNVYCFDVPSHELIVVGDKGKYVSGNCNFSLLFGTSAFSFAQQSLYDEWTKEEARDFVMNNDLTYKVKRRKAVLYGNSPQESEVEKEIDMFTTIGDKDHFANVWVIASFFRENFFKKYKVLKAWIDKCIADAENDGFTRSSHGIIRRLPYLYYKGKDSSNIKIKNNQNISINSRVQSFESVVVNRWLLDVWNYTREHNLRSYIMGCIHDAGEMYSINSEEQEFIKIVHEFGEKDYPEYNGIPLEVESNLADYHGTYKATKMEKNKKTGEMEEVNAWEVWDQGKEVTY